MPLVTKCETCEGRGSLKCQACVCRSCEGSGALPCTKCRQSRMIDCKECSATGKTACRFCSGFGRTSQGFWVIKWSAPCSVCGGAATRQCGACAGRRTVPCDACDSLGVLPCGACSSTGVDATCTACAGSRLIRCTNCDGAGEFETEWSRQLQSRSIDWLRFEYEKRQRSIQALQTQVARLDRTLQDLWDLQDEWNNDENATWAPPLTSGRMDQVDKELELSHKQIAEAEREMAELQRVLDSK